MGLTCDGLDGIAMYVRRLRLHSCDLTLCLRALLQLCHLLTLNRWRRNLLTQDDVTDLASGQGSDVDTVPLPEVLLFPS